MNTITKTFVAVIAAAASVAAFAQNKYDDGASDTEIRIGHTSPQSGPAAAWGAVGKSMAAYFKMVNDGGGINGRKINFITYDDGYQPPKTVEMTRKLVEADRVLFTAGSMGTAPQLAVAPYLNQRKIPQLFVAAGAGKFTDVKTFPWTLISGATFESEGGVWAKYLAAKKPGAKVAAIFQDDDSGRALVQGFKEKIAGTTIQLVTEQTYTVTDPSIDSQLIAMKNSGADTVLLITIPKMTALALRKIRALSWEPTIFASSGGSSAKTSFAPAGLENAKNVMTAGHRMRPGDNEFANSPDVVAYKAFVAKYLPDVDPTDDIYAMGYTQAALTAHILRQAGNDLTRANIMKQANSFNGLHAPLHMPGIMFNTSPGDHRPVKQFRVSKFDGTQYVTDVDVFDVQ
jgi:branched-chain amino acid transport system substrate-binding protein